MDGLSFEMEGWAVYMQTLELMYKGLLEDKHLLQSLKDSKFDLGISEYFDLGSLGIFEILNINTTICAAALGWIGAHYDISGMPQFHSFIPGYATTFGDKMTFRGRLINIKAYYQMRSQDAYWTGRMEVLFRKSYPEMEDFSVLADVIMLPSL